MELEQYAQKLLSKLKQQKLSGNILYKNELDAPFPEPTGLPFLEIGCGAGLHPILYAKHNPDHHLYALERTHEKFHKFQNRVDRHALKNISALHADGLYWLEAHREKMKGFFNGLYLLYPNPYPKNSQRNKRFFAMPSFQLALDSLKPGSVIELRTNIASYDEEANYLATHVWNLKVKERMLVKKAPSQRQGITHFERKYIADEQDCFISQFIKT